jgi:hypothetical protein
MVFDFTPFFDFNDPEIQLAPFADDFAAMVLYLHLPRKLQSYRTLSNKQNPSNLANSDI